MYFLGTTGSLHSPPSDFCALAFYGGPTFFWYQCFSPPYSCQPTWEKNLLQLVCCFSPFFHVFSDSFPTDQPPVPLLTGETATMPPPFPLFNFFCPLKFPYLTTQSPPNDCSHGGPCIPSDLCRAARRHGSAPPSVPDVHFFPFPFF